MNNLPAKRSPFTVLASELVARPAVIAVGFLLLLGVVAKAQNTQDIFTSGTSLSVGANWSLTTVPTVSNDAVFNSSSPSGNVSFSATSGTYGSLDDTHTGVITSGTNISTVSTLTLGGAGDLGNSVSATSSDLIYVASGASTVLTLNGGTGAFNLVLGQSGGFDAGTSSTLNIGTAGAASTLNLGTNTLTVNGAGAVNIGSIISNGSLAVSAGTTTLSGNNTFSGGVALSGGTLLLNSSAGAGTGTITINGGTLESTNTGGVPNYGNAMTWNASFNLFQGNNKAALFTGNVLLGNSGITIGTNGNYPSKVIILAGAISDGGNGYGLGITNSNAPVVLAGANTYTGLTTINSGAVLYLGGTTSGNNAAAGAAGQLAASGTIADNGTLDFNRTNTVTQGTDFSSSPITGAGAVAQVGGGALVLNAANTYSGGTTLTTGTLALSNALAVQNSIVTISAGTGTTGANNGVQFTSGLGDAFTVGGLSGASSEALFDTAGNPVALSIGNNNDTGMSYSGNLTGSGTLTKIGTGIQTLAGLTNTVSVSVNSGTLQLGPTAGTETGTYTYGALSIAAGAVATQYANSGVVNSNYSITIGVLSGSGNLVYINANSGGASNFSINETANTTFSGNIAPSNTASGGFIALFKNGSGTLNLNGPAGDLDLQRGFVVDAGGLTLSGSSTFVLGKTDASGGRNNIVANQGAAFTLDDSGINVNSRLGNAADDGITLNGGSFNLIGSGTTTSTETVNGHVAGTGGASTSYGLGNEAGSDVVNVTAGTGQSTVLTITNGGLSRGAGATALFEGTNLGTTPGANVATIKFGTAPTLTGTGSVGTPSYGVIAGSFVDSVTSGPTDNYSIATYDATDGVRALAMSETVGTLTAGGNILATSALTNSTVSVNSLTLGIGGSIDNTAGTLTDSSGTILSTGASTGIGSGGGGTLEVGATGTNELVIYNASSSSLNIGASITATGGLTTGGAGTLILTANNSGLSGAVTVNGGILSISAANNLGSSASLAINNGGEFQSTGASVSLSTPITIGGVTANTITSGDIDVSGGAGNTLALTGGIAGVGSLTKSGIGILSVSNTNTYSGATTVSAGTLLVSGSLSGTPSVSVANGATLEVNGLVNLSAVDSISGTLQGTGSVGSFTAAGGTVNPGMTAANTATASGTLTASGAVALSGSTNFSIRLGTATATDHDQLTLGTAASTINLAGANLELTIGANYAQQTNGFIWVLINGAAANDIIGTFSEGSTFTASNGNMFSILYNENATGTGAGDDVVLEAVPEPGTWAMMLGGLAMLIAFQRSSRRSMR